MKAYKVTVNGTVYEVTLEVIDKADVKAPEKQPEKKPENAAPASAGTDSVKAPMPGNILSVNVQPGASVKKGDVLFILEAMKMENEIMAPRDGVVASVDTQKGSSVETGAVLCTLR